jgi:hypothetical protein
MITARVPTKIAYCLTLATVLTLSSDLVELVFFGLLVAILGGLWLRRAVELARLQVVEPHA